MSGRLGFGPRRREGEEADDNFFGFREDDVTAARGSRMCREFWFQQLLRV